MSLFGELRRRNVLRVAAAYVTLSWLIIQVNETLFPMFGLSDAAARTVVLLLAIGFIPALIFAWAFELTPEGLKRDREVDRDSPVSRRMAKRLDRIIIVFLVLALGYFAVDKFVLAPQREATVAEEAREAGRTEALIGSFGDKSIAVLPFTDMSPERDQAWFSDGIAEELLNLLAKLDDLRVISRSSSFALRDEGLSTPEMAQRLKVAYVLEGSVRKAGNLIRITAQLIEARTDTHVWSETYDRELVDVFAIQDQISAQVVKELEIRILGPTTEVPPTSTAAYDLYLRGLSALAVISRGDREQPVELFEQVIALDPAYAPAHGSLAIALVYSSKEDSVRNPAIEAAASRALELDPTNSDAFAAIGRLRSEQGRREESTEAFEQAIKYNPNNALAYRWLGSSFSESDPARYLAMARKAYLVDPLNPTIRYHVSLALTLFGRTDEALAVARDGLSLDLGDGLPYELAGMIHENSGRLDLALKSFYRSYRIRGGQGHGFGWASTDRIPLIMAVLGETRLAENWIPVVWMDDPQNPWRYFQQIVVAAEAGQQERANQLTKELIEGPRRGDKNTALGFIYLNLRLDFEGTRSAWESGRLEPGRETLRFDPSSWGFFVDYAFVLQKTGAAAEAQALIDEIIPLIESQLASGVIAMQEFALHVPLAALHAMNDDIEVAVSTLLEATPKGGLTCTSCLRNWPHFDSLRAYPEFEAFVTMLEARNEAQRQGLVDEGMLLTPEELLALMEFTFDPFDTNTELE